MFVMFGKYSMKGMREINDATHWRFNIACLECTLPVDLPARQRM